ncbi:MAG: type ISP restriction/modification enzyme, partial [Chitinophagaceae bacterium]
MPYCINPTYRKKYELNLKREFPRIPLYDNFKQWASWGKRLIELHIDYESAPLYKLDRLDTIYEAKSA